MSSVNQSSEILRTASLCRSVDGDVTLKDASGKVLDKFSVSTSYALGGFAGGSDSRIDWLYEAFAKQVVGQFVPQAAAAKAKP